MAKIEKAAPNAQIRQNTHIIPDAETQFNPCINPLERFRHCTTTNPDGTVLYACPMEIKTQDDLNNYGITWDACRTLNFHGSEKVTVYFLMVESRELAEDQWKYLDTQHRNGYRNNRCWVPGKQKPWVRCRDTNSCSSCPFKGQRKPPFISWDRLIASGYEPTAEAPADEQAIAKTVWKEICAMMDAEDVRIAKAFTMHEYGYKGKEISAELGISLSRVSNLIARAQEIAKAYKEKQNC